MIYNITVVYNNGKIDQCANILCNCENDDQVILASTKWVENRWAIWQEMCDAKKIVAIRIRDYPIGSPLPDGSIKTGDSIPFFDWSNNQLKCPKGLKRNAKKYLKTIQKF